MGKRTRPQPGNVWLRLVGRARAKRLPRWICCVYAFVFVSPLVGSPLAGPKFELLQPIELQLVPPPCFLHNVSGNLIKELGL